MAASRFAVPDFSVLADAIARIAIATIARAANKCLSFMINLLF
jgi:hypothetical protein